MLCTLIGVSGENCASVSIGLIAALVGVALGAIITWLVAKHYAIETKNDIDTAINAATNEMQKEVAAQLSLTGDAIRGDIARRLEATATELVKTIPDDAAAKVTKNTLVNTAINAAPFLGYLAAELMKSKGDDKGSNGSNPER